MEWDNCIFKPPQSEFLSIQNKMHDNAKYEVKSGVVTLSAEVNSQCERDLAGKVATRVPNVKQVANDLQVKNQKASSSQQELRSPAAAQKAMQSRTWREHCILRRPGVRSSVDREVKNGNSGQYILPPADGAYTRK